MRWPRFDLLMPRRRPRGFLYGVGRFLNPCGRPMNPAESLLNLAGLKALARDMKYMFAPPIAPTGKEHYIHNGKVWSADGVTLSRGSAKNRLNQTTGLIVTDAAGVLGPNGQIEAAATNIESKPSDIAGWSAIYASVTVTNASLSVGAFSLANVATTDGNGATNRLVNTTATAVTNGLVYTVSALVKHVSGSTWVLFGDSGHSNWHRVFFNLATGAVGNAENATGRITDIGNGVYLLEVTYTVSSTANLQMYFLSCDENTETLAAPSVLKFGGVQCEAGAFATTIIGSAATRAADALSIAPGDLADLQNEGTLVAVCRPSHLVDYTHLLSLEDLSDGLKRRANIYFSATQVGFYSQDGAGASITPAALAVGTPLCVAQAWNAAGVRCAANGTLDGYAEATAIAPSALCVDGINNYETGGAQGHEVLCVLLFKVKLNDAELARFDAAFAAQIAAGL